MEASQHQGPFGTPKMYGITQGLLCKVVYSKLPFGVEAWGLEMSVKFLQTIKPNTLGCRVWGLGFRVWG